MTFGDVGRLFFAILAGVMLVPLAAGAVQMWRERKVRPLRLQFCAGLIVICVGSAVRYWAWPTGNWVSAVGAVITLRALTWETHRERMWITSVLVTAAIVAAIYLWRESP